MGKVVVSDVQLSKENMMSNGREEQTNFESGVASTISGETGGNVDEGRITKYSGRQESQDLPQRSPKSNNDDVSLMKVSNLFDHWFGDLKA